MLKSLLPIFAALAAAGCSAAAQTPEPPPSLTWLVLTEVNGFLFDIDNPTNMPPLETQVPDGTLVPVDVSHDGVSDWLIRWPESSQFCGTGGCRTTLYVSTPDGLMRAFDQQTQEGLEFRNVNNEAVVEGWFHQSLCDYAERKCLLAWVWDREQMKLIDTAPSDAQPAAPAVDADDEAGHSPVTWRWPTFAGLDTAD